MKHTDMEMVMASQIAYMDFDMEEVASGYYTVQELLERELNRGTQEHRSKAAEILNRIATTPGASDCGNWKIRDIRNNQHSSGMYACLIETSDSNAIIAFRGSESDTLENKIKDWAISDFGLLDNVLTPQQATAEIYIKDIYKKYGDKYSSFDMTGHSLGGNLAEHATITAPDGMRDKINRCVNLDGPGYSNIYMRAHASDIEKSKGIIEHYQWSLIGTLLTPVPGTKYQTIQANTPSDKGGELSNMAWRHDTNNVSCDENGNFIEGKKDWLANTVDPIADVLDLSLFTIFIVPNTVLAFTYDMYDQLTDQIKNLWDNWQSNRYSSKDVQFGIYPKRVKTEAANLSNVVSKLNTIEEEVMQIQRQLAFDSISAGYIKIKLWSIANGIENDAKKLSRYSEKGQECSQYYIYSEEKITDVYTT